MKSLVIEGLGQEATDLQTQLLASVDVNIAGSDPLPAFELESLRGYQFGPMNFDHFSGTAYAKITQDASLADEILATYQSEFVKVYMQLQEVWLKPERDAAKVYRAVHDLSTDKVNLAVGKLRGGIVELLSVRRLLQLQYAEHFLAASIAATD